VAAALASKTLAVVEQLAQAAITARNSFVTEVNNAKAQHREVHAAAQRRLESELAKIADGAAGLSDRLFFGSKRQAAGAEREKKSAPEAAPLPAPPQRSPTPQPRPPPSRPRSPAVTARATEEADLEVAEVSARVEVAQLQEELARLRQEKHAERVSQRAEFDALVEAAAEERASAEVSALRTQLAQASGERELLIAELDRLAEEQTFLQERLHEAQVTNGEARGVAEGYDMDSVSVVPGMRADDTAGYAAAVHRLEERVLALSRQLAAEHAAREKVEAVLRDKGISVPHLRLATSGVSPALLRTVQRTTLPPLPPDAPMKMVRSTLALVEARCLEAEEGHAASAAALENVLRIMCAASGGDRTDVGGVMAALPALSSLAAPGAAARALLSVGAAAAVGESMLAHKDSAGLLCEGCTTLCVLAGGLLSPLGLAPGAAKLEARRRNVMSEQVAGQAGRALVRVGEIHARNSWVMLAVARTLGVLARSPAAATQLLSAGAAPLLSRTLAAFASDASEYETASMTALALMAFVASSPENAAVVDKSGGRAALQEAQANSALGRALAMEYPLQTPWLSGAPLRTRRSAALLACFSRPALDEPQPAEERWLEAVRRAKSPRAAGGSTAGGSTAAPSESSTPTRASGDLRLAGLPPPPARAAAPAFREGLLEEEDEECSEEEDAFMGQL